MQPTIPQGTSQAQALKADIAANNNEAVETAFQTDAFQQQQLAFQTNTPPASGPVPVEVADTYRPLEEITGKYGGG